MKLTQAALKRQFDGLIRRAPGDPWCPLPTPNRGLSDSFCFRSAHECGRANSGKSGIDPKKHELKRITQGLAGSPTTRIRRGYQEFDREQFAFLAMLMSQVLINAASSTGRCNTIQHIDSTVLPRENHLFVRARPKASQGSVSAGLTLANDFGFVFNARAVQA